MSAKDSDHSKREKRNSSRVTQLAPIQQCASTTLSVDSHLSFALPISEDGKVRVDTYRIPLAEIKAEVGKTIGIAYLGRSTKPVMTVNSVGYESTQPRYYAFNLPVAKFGEIELTPLDQSLDLTQIPDGRKDKKRAKKPNTKPLLQVGAVPPPLTAKGWLGTETRPTWEKLRGKVVLVDFWATWCGPCVAAIPHMNELQKKHEGDLAILGVTDQSRGGIKRFQEETEMNYAVGVGSELGAEFGAKALPHAFIIGRDGKLFWEGLPSDEAFEGKLSEALEANAQPTEEPKVSAADNLKPGETRFIPFPNLGKTWRDVPARAGVYLPTDYSTDRKFPLFVWFGGGAGSDNPARAAAILNGAGYICVALPYRNETDEQQGGWQTPWSYYAAMMKQVETMIPNIDATRRACGGFSSGGAAILHQIGNSDGAFQNYFHAFVPSGAGWPMGGLETIKDRPMLAIMGENDKRIANYEKLHDSAMAAGVNFTFLKIPDTKHKFPESIHAQIRQWLAEHLAQPAE